jgi:hypothetical protein
MATPTLHFANRYLNAPEATSKASADDALNCVTPVVYGGKSQGSTGSLDSVTAEQRCPNSQDFRISFALEFSN